MDDPFALRLLTPWLVRRTSAAIGMAPDTVWLAVSFVATVCALVVVYEWLRGPLRISAPVGLAAVLMLAVTYRYASYAFTNLWLVDPINNLVYALALLLAWRGRLLLFTAVIAVGFVNKETALLVAPLFPLLAWARSGTLRDRRVWLGAAATVALAAAYLAFRAWALAHIGPHGSHVDGGFLEVVRFALSSRPRTEHLALFSVFMFLWALLAIGLTREWRRDGLRSQLCLSAGYLLAVCLLGRIQATDTERVFVMLGPVVVAAAALVFETWREGRPWMWVLGLVYAALHLGWVTGETAAVVNLAAIVGVVHLLRVERSQAVTAPVHLLEHRTSLSEQAHAGRPLRAQEVVQPAGRREAQSA